MGRASFRSRAVRFKILGHPWECWLLSRREFTKRHGKDTAAVAILQDRKIELSSLDLEDLKHELTHAYYEELCLRNVGLSKAQMEEFNCDFMAKYGKRLNAQAEMLFEKLSPKKSL